MRMPRLIACKDFLSMTNVADILQVGEKCFKGELYRAAKLPFKFTSISNWAHLGTTLIYLGKNQATMEGARKAGNTHCPVSRLLVASHFIYWSASEDGF